MIAAIAEKHLKIVNLIRGLQYRMAIWFRMRRISWGFDSRKMLVRTIRSSTALRRPMRVRWHEHSSVSTRA
jgi:hypothetical protein